MKLRVADITLTIASETEELSLEYSPCHEKFVEEANSGQYDNDARGEELLLQIEDTKDPPRSQLTKLLCENEIWQLFLDNEENLVFTQPKQIPQRWIVIDPEFHTGKIIGDFSGYGQTEIYPLQYIDIVIFSNWLAKFGDLILHASGIAYEGEGYCFLGDSGAGKSTLVRDLSENPRITILGEDQVVLRKMNGQFVIFGTPWHETPEMCSPMGVPLRKVFFLDRNAPQTITPVREFDAVVKILQTAFYPIYRPEAVERVMEKLSSLAGQAGFYTLAYERGTDVLQEILNA